jgi:hypothetical protein
MESLENLMPTINPNIDELIDEDDDSVIPSDKPKNNEMFICNNKVKKLESKDEEVDVIVVEEPEVAYIKPKKKYPHLEKARATALANRQRKARAKAELKELENIKKLEIKEEKKKLRIEKNRTNARNNYHKKKEELSLVEIPENDILHSEKIGLTYQDFEKYMNTYNKKVVNKPDVTYSKPEVVNKPDVTYSKPDVTYSKPEVTYSKPQSVVKKLKVVNKPVSHHPVNYYNPHQRNKINLDDLFSL